MSFPNTSRFHVPDMTTDTIIESSSLFSNDLQDTIPTFHLNDDQSKDPIKFIESVYDQAKEYGAIKVILSPAYQNTLNSNIQLNNISFNPITLFDDLNDGKLSKFTHVLIQHWNINSEKHQNKFVKDIKSEIAPKSSPPQLETNNPVSTPSIPQDSQHPLENIADVPQLIKPDVKPEPVKILEVEPSVQDQLVNNIPPSNVSQSPCEPGIIQSKTTNVSQIIFAPENSQPGDNIPYAEGSENIPQSLEIDRVQHEHISQARQINPESGIDIAIDSAIHATKKNAKESDKEHDKESAKESDKENDKGSAKESDKESAKESIKSEPSRETVPTILESMVPSINGKPLNLFKLFNYVDVYGGYQKVNHENLWQEICLELEIDTSCSNLIQNTYFNLLQPLETTLKDCLKSEVDNDVQSAEISSFTNAHGKRLLEDGLPEPKRLHKSDCPPIIKPLESFSRSIKSKLSKGFPLASLNIDPKESNTLSCQNYINHILKLLVQNNETCQDQTNSSARVTLNDYIKRDLLVQDYIKKSIVDLDDSNFLYSQLDDILWKFLKDYKFELKVGKLSSNSTNFGFVKTHGTNINGDKLYQDFISDNLCPWNLHNLPIIPNSLLGTMVETDLNNPEIATPRLNIGGTLTMDSWDYQDHFAQLANYHLIGADKVWYFIPESEYDKFEQLTREFDQEVQNQETTRTPRRLQHSNPTFQKIMKPTMSNKHTIFLTPKMLKESGIIHHVAVQKPGEFIIQYPKSYSTSTSLGFNVTEEVNFTTNCWLNYAVDAEEWLSTQGVIPNFSMFKMMINLIQVFDSGKNIGYGSDVYARIQDMYETLCTKELDLRQEVRKLKIKETIIDEKYVSFADAVTDVDLKSGFPSRVTITDRKDKSKVSMTMDYFLQAKESLMSSKNFTIQLNLYYSDEKLKNFSKIISNYSIDFKKWLQDYETIMKDTEQLSLKIYKSILTDGEKIASAVESAANNDCRIYIRFKKALANLKQFIANSNQFIEECQNLLAIKHQQRIRNNTEYQRASLHDLVKLIDAITSLNFSSTETDQILELQQEIENFDKASRVLISKKNKTTQEFNDLINLGESFGIEIPSLNFITRIRDRIKWIKVFNLIDKGADPFSDKKEVFSLQNLLDFYNEGKKILAAEDSELFESIQIVVNNSEKFNQEVTDFLKYEFVDDIDLKTLEEIAERIRVEKIFISTVNYTELSKLHLNSHLITQLQEFKVTQKTFLYSEVKQLQNSLRESGLRFNSDTIVKELYPAEAWVYSVWDIVRDVSIISTMDKAVDMDHLNLRVSLNLGLIEKLYQIYYKAEYNFSTDDIFEHSSAYLLKHPQDDSNIKEPPIYCICREYEFGTMIECDSCNEWYHVGCVNEDQKESDEGNYVCPVCKFIESNDKLDKFLKRHFRIKMMTTLKKEGDSLRTYPANEKKVLGELHDQCLGFQMRIQSTIDSIKKDNMATLQLKIDRLKFIIRKMYGSGILMTDQLKNALKLVRDYQKELNPTPIETIIANVPMPTEPYVNDSTAFGNLLAAATMQIDKNQIQKPINQPVSLSATDVPQISLNQNKTYTLNDIAQTINSETENLQHRSVPSSILVQNDEPPQIFDTFGSKIEFNQVAAQDEIKSNPINQTSTPIVEEMVSSDKLDTPKSTIATTNLSTNETTAADTPVNTTNTPVITTPPTASIPAAKMIPDASLSNTTTNQPFSTIVTDSKSEPQVQPLENAKQGPPMQPAVHTPTSSVFNSSKSAETTTVDSERIPLPPLKKFNFAYVRADDSIDPSLR